MSPNLQQFVKYPANILAWRRYLSATKWTVLSVIHDKIARWDKESDAVSNSQIAAETTLSESSIRRAIAEMNTTDGPLEVTTLGTRGIPVYRIRPCDRCQSDRYQSDTRVNLTPLASFNGCQPDTPVSLTGVNVTPTIDVHIETPKESRKGVEGQQETEIPVSPVTSTGKTFEENGSVSEMNSMQGTPASGCLVGTPTSQVLFVNPKTGKTWKIGQEVECLAHEAKITMGEAEALLVDGNGKDVPTILSLLKKSWTGIKGAVNRVAYMRGIIRNQTAAKPMRKTPPPVPLDPLPTKKQAELWCDEHDDCEPKPEPEPGGGLFDEDGEAPAAANSMPANEPAAAQERAAAVEVTANPAPAPEAATEPVAQNDVMPTDLSFDEKVRWCLDRGINRPYDIGEKTGEHMAVVIRSLNLQTMRQILVEYEGENGQTLWRISKPATLREDRGDDREESQWLN